LVWIALGVVRVDVDTI